jgi:hypothetical protein
MTTIRRLLYCALIAIGVAGCAADVSTSGNDVPPANFPGEAESPRTQACSRRLMTWWSPGWRGRVNPSGPAMTMGDLYQARAQTLSNAAHDATIARQLAFAMAQAAFGTEGATLYSTDIVSTGIATAKIIDADLIRHAMEGIRQYLKNRPDSADTAKGIRMWWMNWDDYPGVDSLALTLSALARLEQAGEIEGIDVGNGIDFRRKSAGA